jgi:hypothetical protein
MPPFWREGGGCWEHSLSWGLGSYAGQGWQSRALTLQQRPPWKKSGLCLLGGALKLISCMAECYLGQDLFNRDLPGSGWFLAPHRSFLNGVCMRSLWSEMDMGCQINFLSVCAPILAQGMTTC